jgi:hypothetical protein
MIKYAYINDYSMTDWNTNDMLLLYPCSSDTSKGTIWTWNRGNVTPVKCLVTDQRTKYDPHFCGCEHSTPQQLPPSPKLMRMTCIREDILKIWNSKLMFLYSCKASGIRGFTGSCAVMCAGWIPSFRRTELPWRWRQHGSLKVFISNHHTTRCKNRENHELYFHRSENITPRCETLSYFYMLYMYIINWRLCT